MNQCYKLIKEEPIEELNGTGYLLKHKKTGARVVVISNDDDNKVFQIGFKTPPSDDTGVPHILEHSVLCGSREFPLKDPFVELVKGSLNTFLNAMTYPDKTVYPVASCNEKDFHNLVHVYLDAVFYPNIYSNPKIMEQEGWHYHLEQVEDPLTYNGVVYNEMKGVFSSPDQQLSRAIQKSLLPDTPYGFESGGDPASIPELTRKDFLEFHSTYYHPSNSYIYLYGDMDMEEYLSYLDEAYLSDFEEKQVDASWDMQPAFRESKRIEEYYPVGLSDDEEDKTYLSYNTVIGNSLDRELYLAFQILDRAIFDAEGAPVSKALMDAGIGKDISSSYDNGIEQPIFSVIAQEAREEQTEEFVRIIETTIQEIVEKGIDERSLLAAVNYFEFKYKEGDFGRYPKGLMYGLKLYDSWLYDENQPFIHIKTNELFQILKERIKTSYYTDLLAAYFLKNNHKSIVVLKPKSGMQKEMDQQTKKRLAQIKERMTKEELNELVKNTRELRAYQEEPAAKEDLEKIPLLDLKDIRKEVRPLSNREWTVADTKVLWHVYQTNGICYLKLAFHMEDVPEPLIPYGALLTEVFKAVNTKKRSYYELGNEISLVTGGIGASIEVLPKSSADYTALFTMKTKCFYPHVSEALDLVEEIMFDSRLDDGGRLKEIIGQIYAGMKIELTEAGHKTAAGRAMSNFSPYARYQELIQGISMFEFIKNLYEHFSERQEEITNNLQMVCQMIFRKEHLLLSYTGEEKEPEFLSDDLKKFTARLYTKPVEKRKPEFLLAAKKEAFPTAGSVQYVAAAGNFAKQGLQYTGALKVLQVIFSYDYLWIEIRVKGGAYGCMCSFNFNGDSSFVSYRDPNLEETYDVYRKAERYVKEFAVSDRDMIKYIIGAISSMDMPLMAEAMGDRSFQSYMIGKSEADLQRQRDEVLGCTQKDIRELAPIVAAVISSGNYCTIGSESKINACQDVFDSIENNL